MTSRSVSKWTYVPPSRFEGGSGNYVLNALDFYVSYAPDTSGSFYEPFGKFFGEHQDGAETALVKGIKFLILRGDWRADYERLAPSGYRACVEFYEQHKAAHRSRWSIDDDGAAQ
jgi:hypothetical protein